MLNSEDKKQLEQIAAVGFAYSKMLKAIPAEISILYTPFFKGKRGQRRSLARFAYIFSSISLAIAEGRSALERDEFVCERDRK